MHLDVYVREPKHEQGADCDRVQCSCNGGERREIVVDSESNGSNRGHNILQVVYIVIIITPITGRKMAFHERKVYILPEWVWCGSQYNYTWRKSEG